MSSYCNVCGHAIRGQHYVYRRQPAALQKGLVVCSNCERTAPRCTVCGMPMNTANSRDGLCPVCAVIAPVCAACGRRIKGGYVQNAGNGAIYCETCYSQQPRCSVCAGAVGLGGFRLHDGRFICAECHATAVSGPEKAGALYRRVVEAVGNEPGLQVSLPPSLVLVDRMQMLAQLQRNAGVSGDNPEMVFGLFVRRGHRRTMYIESGLPQILMIQVMAHEYAHAWQGENCPLLCDPLVREGFAEWVAHRTLTALGSVKKAALMEQRSDLYGQGLKLMLAWEKQGGRPAVIDGCRLAECVDSPDGTSLAWIGDRIP